MRDEKRVVGAVCFSFAFVRPHHVYGMYSAYGAPSRQLLQVDRLEKSPRLGNVSSKMTDWMRFFLNGRSL